MTQRRRRDRWPTSDQELLLRAALAEEDHAAQAWAAWHAGNDIDDVDPVSFRLLPLVARRLRSRLGDIDQRRLTGVWRATWCRNQLLLQHAEQAVMRLEAAGIRAMVLKGVALSLLYYPDVGQRSMIDIDILVPTERLWDAYEELRTDGWSCSHLSPGGITFELLTSKHAIECRHLDGTRLDLHWHALARSVGLRFDHDAAVWGSAVPIRVRAAQSLALCPTDQLFHVCSHGMIQPRQALHWIADAMTILREHPIDWDRFLEHTRQTRQILRMRAALGFLHDLLGANIPPSVRTRIATLPTTCAERIEYRAIEGKPTVLNILVRWWFHYSACATEQGARRSLLRFLRHLQVRLGARSVWMVLLLGVSKVIVRAFRTLRCRFSRISGR